MGSYLVGSSVFTDKLSCKHHLEISFWLNIMVKVGYIYILGLVAIKAYCFLLFFVKKLQTIVNLIKWLYPCLKNGLKEKIAYCLT